MKMIREGVVEVNGKEYRIDQVGCGSCDLVVSDDCDMESCAKLLGPDTGLKEIK